MNEPEKVDPSKLLLGPIRYESLSPEMLERIKAIFRRDRVVRQHDAGAFQL